MPINPVRLITQLQNTGLQNKDNPLYQLLFQMIQLLQTIANQTNKGGSIPKGTTTIINQILNQFGGPTFDGINGEDGFSIPGAIGATGATGATGSSGTAGAQGIMGPPGIDGNDGYDAFILLSSPGSSPSSGVTLAQVTAAVSLDI